MNLKRIIIVSSEFPPQPGGIGNHAFNLAKYLQQNGFNIKVISDNRSRNGEVEKRFDEDLPFSVHRVNKRRIRLRMYFRRIQLLFRHIKTSEVVIASGKFSLWIVAFCGLFYNRHYIAIIHGSEVNYKSKPLKFSIDISIKRFSKIIAVSHYTKSLLDHLNLNNIIIIPNGFDFGKWSSKQMKCIALKGNPKLITVGNITERKGQLHVIKHLPELLNVFPDLHYHCVGIPTESKRFIKIAKDLQVSEHVTFHGQVDDNLLQQLLVTSDVFIMLSNETLTGDVEGFGIAILEANALGVPAIGSIGCGIEDAIDQNTSGMLIKYDDSQALIHTLKTILDNKVQFSKQAKDWAEAHDWNLIVKQYIHAMNL
ncbi:glycosyltransferase family 4 protein [Yeosuana sp. MJ-SS3]|uniref:Glycosyltransferase family 4 protein n=1 Tax=Gilvirhabdus luticola TaxID=3079858 RepID=A0ABU3U4X4_9FLAO|nr:glycosyltransferase family 4 protein [Yeosuana sp. MJ-SS3]MDU8885458.1 glycosyltransferase family 4 protein [Yeosuana sp. MJ-SS3]